MWHPFESWGGWTVFHVHGHVNPTGAKLAGGLLKSRRQAELLAAALNRRESWATLELSADQRRRYV